MPEPFIPSEPRACNNCKFWSNDAAIDIDGPTCRKRCPHHTLGFPVIQADWWCGEHKYRTPAA